MTQDKLKKMLAPAQPIQRGKPLELSTTEQGDSAPPRTRTIAPTQQKEEGPKRTKRGYALREDLIDRCKHLAIGKKMTLYEIMEAALEMYLEVEEGEPQPVESKNRP